MPFDRPQRYKVVSVTLEKSFAPIPPESKGTAGIKCHVKAAL